MPPATATQTGRSLSVLTPLGKDKLMVTKFVFEDALSTLFRATVEVQSKRTDDVNFEKLLGQPVAVSIAYPGGQEYRHFHGICNRISQGQSDIEFTGYRLQVVPNVWMLTKRTMSRTFQQINVPDILKKVLAGFDFEQRLQGTFHPRDYCIQYRESDWDFASRLMEEEGIFYFFEHSDSGHKLILGNSPEAHTKVTHAEKIIFKHVTQAPAQDEDFIYEFEKSQEMTAGKVTLWDNCFEMPDKNLETKATIQQSLKVGQVTHNLSVGDNGVLELYDFPGEYAQRFDGIAPGGGDRPEDTQKIFEDGARTANIRMQAEAANAIRLHGTSTCRQLTAGHKFTLATISQDVMTAPMKAAGVYVVHSVNHFSSTPDFRSGSTKNFTYSNKFVAIPFDLPFRPKRETYKPVMPGATTATVVGPSGEEIFTDKFGRVKVQFHWDREGKKDPDSSCWVRVASLWAGNGWGMVHVPRIGQEVIVDFLEGDPDQPIITGSVFNAHNKPPFTLPDTRMISGIKTASYPGSGGFNQLTFDDTKSKELMRVHAQKNQTITVGHDRSLTVNNDEKVHIVGNRTENVDKHEKIIILSGREEEVSAGESIKIKGGRTETVDGKESVTVTGDRIVTVSASDTHDTKTRSVTVHGKDEFTGDGPTTWHSKGDLKISSGSKITIQVGESSGIEITSSGIKIMTTKLELSGSAEVSVSGAKINSSAQGTHEITGALVKIN